MTKIKKKFHYHLAENLNEVLANRSSRSTYTFRYNEKGEGFWIKGEEVISIEEFELLYPISILPPSPKGNNPCKKSNWVKNVKSY